MAQPSLSVVSSEIPDPPYPPDTGANGWHPELHLDRIYGSDTWTLAEDDERPWLLRIWCESWRSMPVGSMPLERRLFARRIGCKVAFLDAHAEILLRGWVRHSDGLLYHGFIAGQVVAMLEKRRATAKKVSDWRAEKKRKEEQQQAENQKESVTGYSGYCNHNVPVSNRQEQEQEQEQDKKEGTVVPLSGKPDAASAKKISCDDIEEVISHLNASAGTRFTTQTNDGKVSKAAELVKQRIREHGKPALIAVIDRKVAEWGNDDYWRKFLRPATLFGKEKCGEYVGALSLPTSKNTPTNGATNGRKSRTTTVAELNSISFPDLFYQADDPGDRVERVVTGERVF